MDVSFKKIKIVKNITKPIKITSEKINIIFYGNDNKLHDIFKRLFEISKKALAILDNKKYLKEKFGDDWYEFLDLELLFKKSKEKLIYSDPLLESINTASNTYSDDMFSYLSNKSTNTNTKSYKYPVMFLNQNINLDDNIETIKNKIYVYTNIIPDFQHLCYEYKNNLYPLGYKYKENLRILDVDISYILNKNTISNLIDEKTYFRYKRDKLIYVNESKFLLKDYKNFNNVIGLFDLKKFMSNFNMSQIENLFQDSENKKKFFVSFVNKFWPNINEIKFDTILKNEKMIYLSKDIILNQSLKEQQIINYINSIDINNLKVDLSKSSIILIMFHINYKYVNEAFLNLRSIFDFFETSEEVPFIKFNDSITGKTIKKIYKPILKIVPKNDIIRMIKGEHPHGIHFRIRLSNNPKHPDYHNYMPIINLHSDGKVEFRPSWKQFKNTDFSVINDCVNTITNFIKKINNIHYEISQKSKEIRIPNKKTNNMEITFLNINIKFTLPSKNEINYEQLNEVAKVLNPYVSINNKELNETSNNLNGLYLRYKRVQNYEYYITDAIKILKEVYFFSDKRIIIELMKYFNKTKDEAIRSIDEWNIINIVKSQEEKKNAFKEYGKDIEKTIKKYTKRIGVDLKIQGPKEGEYNITIEGSNSIIQFNDIGNFISRMLYIYDNLDTILKKKNIFSFIFNKNTKGRILISKFNKVVVKDTKKVKNLKIADPNLFDINPSINKNKYKLYSKLCQGDRRQPVIYSEAEYKKLNLPTDDDLFKNNINNQKYALKVKNNTYSNKNNYYVCEDHKYKYPGFLQANKHPQNKCLICCHTSSSINKNKPAKFSTYNSCKGNEEIDDDVNINIKYVKQSGKYLKPYGLGKLPNDFDIFINETMIYKETKNNILENDSDYYLKYGVLQDKNTLFNIIISVLDFKNKNDLLKSIEKLISNDSIFNSLENGKIKYKFKNYKNFLLYLKSNDEIIDEKYTWNLFSQPNLSKKYSEGINIIVIKEDIEGKLNIICPYHDEINYFFDKNKTTLLLYKSEYYMNPVYRIQIKNNKLKIIKLQKNNTLLIDKLLNLYEDKCYKEKLRYENKFEKITNFNIPLNINNTYNELIKLKDYKIKFQTVNNLNNSNGIIMEETKSKNMVFIQVKPSQPLQKIKITDNIFQYNYNDIIKFVNILNKSTNIKIEIIKYIVNNYTDKIIKLLTNYGTTIPITPLNKNKIKIRLPYEVTIFNDNEINKYIKNNEIKDDDRIEAVKVINYKNELYQLFRLELSKKLDNEKDLNIRSKIIKIINNNSFNKLKSNFKELDISSENSRQIIEIVSKEKDINYISLLINDIKLKTDQKQKKLILNILEDNNLMFKDKEIKLKKIILSIIDDLIIISNKVPNLENYKQSNIRKTCQGYSLKSKCELNMHCVFDKNNKCKLFIPKGKDYFDRMILNLVQELLKNILKRNEILNNNMDLIIEKEKYIQRQNEILIDKEDYNINDLYK